MYKEKSFVSAILYVHDNENTVGTSLEFLICFFEKYFESYEIICVNDFSSDNSVGVIREISKNVKGSAISIINMSYFHGLEISMNAGSDLSIGDYVFEFDSTEIDYTEKDILDVYRKELEGYDIVSASSNKPSRISSKLFYWLYSKYAIYSKTVLQTESFRILSRRVINRIGHMNKTVPYRKAVYAYSGLRAANIVYESKGSFESKSVGNAERGKRRELAVDSLLLFTDIGYRFSIFMSLLMLVMTLFVTVYSIIAYIVSNPVEGWTSTILFLAIAFSGLFIVLAVVIKYLQLILQMVFKRQQYSFESIEKLTD